MALPIRTKLEPNNTASTRRQVRFERKWKKPEQSWQMLLREVVLVLKLMRYQVVQVVDDWRTTTIAIEITIDDLGAIAPIMIDGAIMTSLTNEDENDDIIITIIMIVTTQKGTVPVDDAWMAMIDALMDHHLLHNMIEIVRQIVASWGIL